MILRNLFILIAIVIAIWIIRTLINKPAANKTRTTDKGKDMVQCNQCKTYLPIDDAINLNGKNFCSQQHLEDWKKEEQ